MTQQAAVLWLLRATGVVMVANGAWMLAHAFHWFFNIPAGLPDTGNPNGHLIRDVGLAYVILGAALTWSTFALAARRTAYVLAALFMLGHALAHIAEILLGALPSSHWLIDLPLVLLPGMLLSVFAHPAGWRWLTRQTP